MAALVCVVFGFLGGAAVPAGAEEQPSIVKAYGLDWIERVREEAWPQPRERRPVVCLLDTGVAITPDTPADDPNGPIVARLAIDGGSGEPQGNAPEHAHGTQMASIIAAPRNGYGTVGIFPQARIVSVRVTEGAAVYSTPRALPLAAGLCVKWARGRGLGVSTIVMAESFYSQRSIDAQGWVGAASWASAAGALFVAAVGNSEDAQQVGPMSVAEVLPVSAGDDNGSVCSFAKYEAGGSIVGPGCSVDPAWPAGSSAATAAVGALAAARTMRSPSIPAATVRAEIEGDAVAGVDGIRLIDGLGVRQRSFPGELFDFVPAPRATPAPASQVPVFADESGTGVEPAPSRSTELWRPTVTVSWRRPFLTIRRTDRGRRGVLMVRRMSAGSDLIAQKRVSRIRIRLKSKPSRVRVWVEGGTNRPWRSLSRTAKVLSR